VADDVDHLATLAQVPDRPLALEKSTVTALEEVESEPEPADAPLGVNGNGSVPFVLEPAVMMPAETAAVGDADVASTSGAQTTGGLFDAPQVAAAEDSTSTDSADAAATAQDVDTESADVEHERNA
jgi:hypothetical protein